MKHLLILASLAFMAGCATLTEEELYEKQAKRDIEIDEINALVTYCEANAGLAWVYDGPMTSRCRMQNARRRHGEALCIPRHARARDYQCGTNEDVRRELCRSLGVC